MNERIYERFHYRAWPITTKIGQIITVKDQGKKIPVKVTKPNGQGSNVAEGVANGKTYTCWYNNGSWSRSK